MPITYRIDQARGLILTTASGTLTDEEVLELKASLVNDPHFKPGMKELADIRNIDRLDVSPAGIHAMVQHDAEHADAVASHRLALVLPGDFAFGTGRMYEQLTGSTVDRVAVFRDMAEAEAWLDLA